MDKMKIGLIGCGGMMNGHVNSLVTFDDIEIVAVADPRPERTEAMQKRTGAKNTYASHEAFFAGEDKLDAVYIAVEPTAHKGIEETCIERNWPFMVEKPMTLDMNQGKAISDAVTAKKLVTAVGFQDRYMDITDRMINELKEMKVGLVYGSWFGGIPGVWWWMKKDTCGGQLLEQNIHLADMLRYFFGEVDKVYATCSRCELVNPTELTGHYKTLPEYDTDDFSTATFTFKSGVVANLMSCCYITEKGNGIRNGLSIIGRDKSIEYNLRNNMVIYESGLETKINTKTNQGKLHARAFLDAVRAKDPTAVRSPYADAYKTLLMTEAANRSMASGEVIKL